MKLRSPSLHAGLLCLGLTWPLLAAAHPGHDFGGGVAAGFIHPFTGLDHLFVMLAVGAWAAQLGGSARALLPTGFLLCMLAGAGLAIAGVRLPFSEGVIALSVAVLLAAVVLRLRIGSAAAATLVSVFAMYHGYAHATDIPPEVLAVRYMVGFTLATAVLQALGFALATLARRLDAAVSAR
jgi:urease accessory protein